ncbi:response regulator [Flaviaesturariibacter terrae]
MMKINSVLIADDDCDDSEALCEVLESIAPNISCRIVRDGAELMKLLETVVPDLIFLDLDMPHKNGLQCLVEIRAHPQACTIAVVICSASARAVNIQTAYEMGADLFFVKPTTFGEIQKSMADILRLNWNDRQGITDQHCVDGRYIPFP